MRVLIVDDEQLAREALGLLLDAHADVEIVGYARDGIEAIAAIRSARPDLVLMDINMPGRNGLEVVAEIGVGTMPRVVFVTAYDEHAISAFRVNALDYLLKPVTAERLSESLDRARAELAEGRYFGPRLDALLEQLGAAKEAESGRVMIRSGGHVFFLRPAEIDWVEAEGDYITIHTQSRSHLVRETMKNMEKKLAARGFQRIHRSSMVRLDAIRELVSNDSGDYEVVLRDRTVLKLSRSYRDELYRKLVPAE